MNYYNFNKETLRQTSRDVTEDLFQHLEELTDEEFEHFYSSIIDVEQISFLHNSTGPTKMHDGVSYTMSTIRSETLDGLIWYTRSRLCNEWGMVGGAFDGKPVFVYYVGRKVLKYFEVENNEIVAKSKISYVLRINK
jgi:hypothetical protein